MCLLIVSNLSVTAKDTLAKNSITNNKCQTMVLEIKDADKIFKQKEQSNFDKFSPIIIALITVLGSAYISYKIANNQTKLAKEQLELAKKQMEENYRVAIAQVKANNISAARIEWIQNLRPLLAKIISIATKLSEFIEDYDNLIKKGKTSELSKEEREETIKLLNDSTQLLEDYENVLNQIKLFLNLEEDNHADLVEALDTFLFNQWNKAKNKSIKNDIDEEDLIDKSRLVLKEAWEQAKNIN